MIKLEHLVKNYGTLCAVDDVSLEIGTGEVVGLLGPNGAGKSTTMNILTGCLSSTSGRVIVQGIDVLADPLGAKRLIGYLPEQPPLYLDMTVDEYLGFNYDIKGSRLPREAHLAEVCEVVHVGDVRRRVIRNLSKGYRQRVGIAQALLGSPQLIILDEPTVGLDPKQIIEIRDLIRKLGENHTVILSSHILSEVSAVCDHIMIIAHGKLVASDSPENLQKLMSGSMELDLEVKGSIAAVKSALQEISQIDRIEENTEASKNIAKLKVISKENADIREQVFYALADAKLPILEMTHAEKSLEDIFLELTEDVAPTQPEKHKLFSKRKRPEMSDAAAQQTEASEEEAQPGEEKKETVTTKEAESYASHL